MIPLIDVRRENAELLEELLVAAREVLGSGRLILGPQVAAFEAELAAAAGAAHAVGVSSGTDALILALQALGVAPGDEVVTTAYTFFATAGAVARLGARPVFVDIDPATYNLDPALLPAALTPRTRAVLVVHLFGHCAEMAPLLRLCRERGLPLVEDACQALGARAPEGPAGSLGAAGCFSFFPTKNLAACGDAGAVVTADAALAERLRALRVHGARETYRHTEIGTNARLDELQAAFLRIKLRRLAAGNAARRAAAARYARLCAQAGLDRTLRLPVERPGFVSTFNPYVVRAPRRDALREHLTRAGIGTSVYYPVPLPLQPCFAELGHRPGDFPESERAAARTLALPLFPALSEAEQAEVVRAVADFYAGGA